MASTCIDFEHLRIAVREACRRAWQALRAERPSETFYYYGLWTTAVIQRPAPTAASIEGLARVTEEYRARFGAVSQDELRWSETDSPYDLSGDEFFDEVSELFDATGDP